MWYVEMLYKYPSVSPRKEMGLRGERENISDPGGNRALEQITVALPTLLQSLMGACLG